MQQVRPAAVAGAFYPGDRDTLAASVAGMLDDARARLAPDTPVPKALIAPHAGYVYSGPTAALAYAALLPARDRLTRVVLLGPTHRVAVDGLALPDAPFFATPLGRVRVGEVDPFVRALFPHLVDRADVHAQEHSLEVHLPFLQVALGDVEVVPLAVGRAAPTVVADVIDALWGGPETVIVVSSDLSHYLPYAEADLRDEATVARLLALDGPITHEDACGATPVNGLLVSARRRGMAVHLLERCNSGDTAGDRRRVVGYAALAFTPTPDRAPVWVPRSARGRGRFSPVERSNSVRREVK
ncbi:MAG: AmmeMemoRadiSam system protein B [Dermatophilaceae bacterium]